MHQVCQCCLSVGGDYGVCGSSITAVIALADNFNASISIYFVVCRISGNMSTTHDEQTSLPR